MHRSRSETALTDQMVVTDHSAPTAPSDIFSAPEKENFWKKILATFGSWITAFQTIENRKLPFDLWKDDQKSTLQTQRKTKISLFPPFSLSLPPQSSKGKQSLLSPFQPSVNQVFSNKDLVNRVKMILQQNLSGRCERRLVLTIRQLQRRINSSSLKLEIRDWNITAFTEIVVFRSVLPTYPCIIWSVKVDLHVLDIWFHHVSIHHSPDLPNSSPDEFVGRPVGK